MLSKRIWKVTARLRGIVITEMEIYETGEKTFAIAKEEILIFLKIRLTAESPLEMVKKILVIGVIAGVIAEKIIRIVREIGVTTGEISRATGDTEVTTEGISRATGDTEVTTEEISEGIVKFDGITNDIIPQGQITGTDILQSVTGINIQVNHTEEEAGAKLTDVRFFPV